MNFVAIDFETATGERHSACAIGLTEVEGGEIVGTHYTTIRPPDNEYSTRNVGIHGIRATDTEFEETFDGLWPWIRSIVNGKIIVAHNATFDMGVLNACLEHYGLEKPSIRGVFCSCDTARNVLPWLENHKLSTIAKYFDVALSHHDAQSDAEACASVFLRMVRGITPNGALEYIEVEYKEDFVTPEEETASRRETFQNRLQADAVSPGRRFSGMAFVFTGELESLVRADAVQIVEEFGGVVRAAVSRKTTHVVIGPDEIGARHGTGKHRKALELIEAGIPIIIWGEDDFLREIGSEQ